MISELPHLILHFDVNATLIITDPAARLSLDEALDKALKQTDWDGSATYSPLTRVNDSGITKEELLKALKWPDNVDPNEKLCNGQYHFIFPSFFNAVTELAKNNREFTIVFRTFGSDLERIRDAMNEYASGNHPQYSYDGSKELYLSKSNMWKGRYGNGKFLPDGDEVINSASVGKYSLTNQSTCINTTTVLEKEDEIIEVFKGRQTPRSTVACQDHYEWWKFHNYVPSSGKPMWVTDDDRKFHHIFFDDCIHKSASDSIISVRHRQKEGDIFEFMRGEEIINLHGCNTVRVQTTEAIMNHDYFLNKIKECDNARKTKQSADYMDK